MWTTEGSQVGTIKKKTRPRRHLGSREAGSEPVTATAVPLQGAAVGWSDLVFHRLRRSDTPQPTSCRISASQVRAGAAGSFDVRRADVLALDPVLGVHLGLGADEDAMAAKGSRVRRTLPRRFRISSCSSPQASGGPGSIRSVHRTPRGVACQGAPKRETQRPAYRPRIPRRYGRDDELAHLQSERDSGGRTETSGASRDGRRACGTWLVEVGLVVSKTRATSLDVQRPPAGGRSNRAIAGAGLNPNSATTFRLCERRSL